MERNGQLVRNMPGPHRDVGSCNRSQSPSRRTKGAGRGDERGDGGDQKGKGRREGASVHTGKGGYGGAGVRSEPWRRDQSRDQSRKGGKGRTPTPGPRWTRGSQGDHANVCRLVLPGSCQHGGRGTQPHLQGASDREERNPCRRNEAEEIYWDEGRRERFAHMQRMEEEWRRIRWEQEEWRRTHPVEFFLDSECRV